MNAPNTCFFIFCFSILYDFLHNFINSLLRSNNSSVGHHAYLYFLQGTHIATDGQLSLMVNSTFCKQVEILQKIFVNI